jgi:hypothetical protein
MGNSLTVAVPFRAARVSKRFCGSTESRGKEPRDLFYAHGVGWSGVKIRYRPAQHWNGAALELANDAFVEYDPSQALMIRCSSIEQC